MHGTNSMTIIASIILIIILIIIYQSVYSSQQYDEIMTYGPSKTLSEIKVDVSKLPIVKDISRDSDVTSSTVTQNKSKIVKITLTAKEVISEIAPGITYNYWTFNETVPGPFLRVTENDMVIITIKNSIKNSFDHSIDLHASWAPGGGSGPLSPVGSIEPGKQKSFQFKALVPGLYVYHCASPNVPTHIANGLYGMILVEPENGMSQVDKEFYVVQGELYTKGKIGEKGFQEFDPYKLINEKPEYIVFNGRVKSLADKPLEAKVGDKVRIYFGNMGNSRISSFHIIGMIFDKVYREGSLMNKAENGISTTIVPSAGTTIVEFTCRVPGTFVLVDHSLSRIDRGAWGLLNVTGDEQSNIYKSLSK